MIFPLRVINEASKGRTKILDAGCGTGVAALYLARKTPAKEVHGYDISSAAIKEANKLKQEAEEIVRRRLVRFKEMLLPDGVYLMTWAGSQTANEQLITIAEDCSLRFLELVERPSDTYLNWTSIIFRRS